MKTKLTVIMLATMFAMTTPTSDATAQEVDTVLSPPAGSCRFESEDGVASFPFDIFRGDIRFKGKVNGHVVHLLLDDGFMWDELLFWGSPRVDSLDLDYDGETAVGGDADTTKQIPARTASGITVSFPGIEFTEQAAIVTSYISGTANMWWGSVGQVSGTFLRHCVVDINFDKMMITLTDPAKFEYRGDGVAVPWNPMGFGPQAIPATLELHDGRIISMDLLMDLGYNDQLEIATAGDHNINAPERSVAASLGFNIEGTERLGRYGRVRSINIGGYKITDVTAGFVSEEHSKNVFHEAMIGLGVLSRFNLVFDYTRRRLFIEPNESFDNPYEYDMSGVTLRAGKPGSLEITRVVPSSPADVAGLQPGEQISKIDGRAVTEYGWGEIRGLLRREGKVVVFEIGRDGDVKEIPVTLRRLI